MSMYNLKGFANYSECKDIHRIMSAAMLEAIQLHRKAETVMLKAMRESEEIYSKMEQEELARMGKTEK